MHHAEHSKLPLIENHTKILRSLHRMRSQSLVIGFSCRALAQSVQRAGLQPWVIDCCGDLDTIACATRYQKVDALDDHAAIGECVERWQNEAEFKSIFFAGGMENQVSFPNLSSLGEVSAPLSRLRSWQSWEQWAKQAGIAFPETIPLDGNSTRETAGRLHSSLAENSNWLVKDLSQAGGLGVHRCRDGMVDQGSLRLEKRSRESRILQRMVSGDCIGVSFLSGRDGALALGAVRALPHSQHPWSEFIYRGSIGPIPLTREEWSLFDALASCITVETDWLGIWNADFVQTADGWYLLEINPRWSAGMELIDRGWQHSIAWHHAHAVGAIKSSYSWAEQKRLIEEYRKQVAAPIRKEILYLKRPWKCTEQAIASMWGRRWGSASPIPSPWYFGDIPQVKTELGEGYPLCSLFTEVGNDDPGDTKWIAAKAWLQREYQIPIA